jgi:translation initiation factor 1
VINRICILPGDAKERRDKSLLFDRLSQVSETVDYFYPMKPDPLKDLQQLKNLFPDMEPYVPDPKDKEDEKPNELISIKEKAQMKLYVSRDKKHRGGKQVTLVHGHEGPELAMEQLLSKLKSLCSAGGSLKESELIIQGDHVKKVIDFLVKSGYKNVKQKGG